MTCLMSTFSLNDRTARLVFPTLYWYDYLYVFGVCVLMIQSVINNAGVMTDLPPFVSATEIRRRTAQFQKEFPDAVTYVDSSGDILLWVLLFTKYLYLAIGAQVAPMFCNAGI